MIALFCVELASHVLLFQYLIQVLKQLFKRNTAFATVSPSPASIKRWLPLCSNR
ncbi:hypothetical protein [Bacillus mycoides]|uniref:hypothetical protein n=1 Tax=Bacillus mycoides TaxID=1405 RepID=UPI003D203F77